VTATVAGWALGLGLFSGWERVVAVLLKTVVLYGYVLILLRLGGKRTTGRISTFDFISVIVIGPLTAATIISPGIALAEGLVALTAFVALQWVVSSLAIRSTRFAHLVTSPPSVLLAKDGFVREHLRDQRIREDEILATIRASGHASAESVQAVVLESTGDLSVVAAAVPEKPVEQDRPMVHSLDR